MASRRLIRTNFAVALGCAVAWSGVGCAKSDSQPITSKSSKFQVAAADDESPSSVKSNNGSASRTKTTDDDPGPPNLPKPPSRPPIPRGGQPADRGEAGERPGTARGEQTAPAASAPKVNPEKIPDGTPDELFALLEQVEKDGPRGRTNREMLDGIRRWLATRRAICDKVLASKDASNLDLLRAGENKHDILMQMMQAGIPDVNRQILKFFPEMIAICDKVVGSSEAAEADRLRAAEGKLNILLQMIEAEVPGVDQQMVAFCQELKDSNTPPLVRLGRLTDLTMNLALVMSNATQETDGVESAIEAALELEPADESLLKPLVNAAFSLQQKGLNDVALAAYEAIVKRFADSDDEKVQVLLPEISDMARLVSLKYDDALRAAAKDEPEAGPALLTAVEKLLEGKTSFRAFSRVSQTAYTMEVTRHDELAAKIYESLGNAFKDHPDEKVAKAAAQEVESRQRRAGLVGQPLQIEGKKSDGKDFDWKAYEGKVVLVHFWTMQLLANRDELPNIKRNYERYRGKGFEVVGINLDRDRAEVEEFFSLQSLPWTTVVDGRELAEKFGVISIPFVVLVGRDGKVIDRHLHGELLGQTLADIFEKDGSAPDAKATGKTSQSPRSVELSFVGVDEPAATPSRRPVETGRQAKPVAAPASEPQDKNADAAPKAAAENEPNPYLAKSNLKPDQLVDYLLNMQEKPKSIQNRPGFAEAIVEAADRVLAADTSEKFRGIAAAAKLDTLHKKASFGDQQADQQLQQFVDSLRDKPPVAVADSIRFLLLERLVMGSANEPIEKIPDLLTEVKKFCTDEKLEARHLRLASSTVEAINRLEDGDAREKSFSEFGKLFAKSSDKELSRYGKKLAKAPPGKESDLVGKPLELVGATSAGAPFDWNSYRGKVVIVDFWATWCGPCIRELPNVRATHEKYKAKGFDIVGVSIDHDQDALAEFLEKNPLPWTTLAGEGTQDLAQKYGVRAIPTVMLVDRDGKVVAVSHRIDQLVPELEKLLK